MTDVMKPRMLVVDDDARNRKLLKGYLEAAGYEVRVVSNGPSALEAAHNDVPDVVLLDVMMSGMNGYEVCVQLKSHPRTRLCQVALVTALDGSDHTVEGLDHGADDYITKPIRKDEFLAKVRSLLRVRTLMKELDVAQRELEEGAVIFPALGREHRHDAAHRVLPDLALVLQLTVKGVEFGDAGALADAELDPPVADQIQAGHLLGDPGRVV